MRFIRLFRFTWFLFRTFIEVLLFLIGPAALGLALYLPFSPYNPIPAYFFIIGPPLLILAWPIRVVHDFATHSDRDPCEAIFSAFCTYILLALLFVPAYKAASGFSTFGRILNCHSMKIPDLCTPVDYFYFSMITGSTLGYGDFVPTGWIVRLLACVQVAEFWL
ncbi:MAG: hypothetical protein HQ592_08630, partial [Planctomycetes bacterium]|nr:hypothetical protein [Planctomycetota bacterium]